jgi:hypothetical protein
MIVKDETICTGNGAMTGPIPNLVVVFTRLITFAVGAAARVAFTWIGTSPPTHRPFRYHLLVYSFLGDVATHQDSPQPCAGGCGSGHVPKHTRHYYNNNIGCRIRCFLLDMKTG